MGKGAPQVQLSVTGPVDTCRSALDAGPQVVTGPAGGAGLVDGPGQTGGAGTAGVAGRIVGAGRLPAQAREPGWAAVGIATVVERVGQLERVERVGRPGQTGSTSQVIRAIVFASVLFAVIVLVCGVEVGLRSAAASPAGTSDAARVASSVMSALLASLATFLLTAVAFGLTRLRGRAASGGGAGWRVPGRDELTGLPDRRHLLDVAGRWLGGGGHRSRGVAPVGLLLLDLDGMRDVNLALGHEQGDRLIATVGRRLRAALPASTLLARIDGDGFAVLLRGIDAARCERVAADLRAALEPPVMLAATPVRPDASIGIARSPQHGRTVHELLRHAEQAMHAHKRTRDGQPGEAPVNRARLLLRAEVRQAFDRGQIEVTYQPKADLRSGRISGVEALVRWRHPVDGLRGPGAFLTEVDRAGLMPRLTRFVLDQALADCARWRAGGVFLTVSVNVPASVIVETSFVDVVRIALARHRLPSSVLVIELTEDTLVEARDAARRTLVGLRRHGVRVSLDDYGTGFCSLTYLRELPADEVKLDRTFLRDLDADPAAAEIVRSTVRLAHALRMRIVVEGVETQRSWQTLADWQCDEVQGFFIAGPMAGDRIVIWLGEWAARLSARPLTTGPALSAPPSVAAAGPAGRAAVGPATPRGPPGAARFPGAPGAPAAAGAPPGWGPP
ncbi:EAL domain-containing protein, partial [Frankia sp. AgPm24]|uniref:putative bifunctional diguanylate cyclase/phosphodiesterase n=1 Tax=Frankia sp. AgPm24 TaxID=631128 RepID=UPI0020103C69